MGANKMWVALFMGLIQTFQVYSGVNLGLSQEAATAIVSALTVVMVWLVPNMPGVSLLSLIRMVFFK